MAKLAVVATLATMLVRFKWFRGILLTERRDWPERLIFAAGLGLPLTLGVVSRLLLDYRAADLTLSGAYLAGLVAGPYAGAIVGAMVGCPPLFAHEYAALPFAIGCGFAGGGLREICPKEEIWRFTPLFFTQLHRTTWRLIRRWFLDWQIALVTAPVHPRDHPPDARPPFSPSVLPEPDDLVAVGAAARGNRALRRDSHQDLEQRAHRAPAGRAGTAADDGARRGPGQPDQSSLPVQHADVDLIADPLAAGDGAPADRETVGAAAPAAAASGALRHAARRTGGRSTNIWISSACASVPRSSSRRRSTTRASTSSCPA